MGSHDITQVDLWSNPPAIIDKHSPILQTVPKLACISGKKSSVILDGYWTLEIGHSKSILFLEITWLSLKNIFCDFQKKTIIPTDLNIQQNFDRLWGLNEMVNTCMAESIWINVRDRVLQISCPLHMSLDLF